MPSQNIFINEHYCYTFRKKTTSYPERARARFLVTERSARIPGLKLQDRISEGDKIV